MYEWYTTDIRNYYNNLNFTKITNLFHIFKLFQKEIFFFCGEMHSTKEIDVLNNLISMEGRERPNWVNIYPYNTIK